MSDIWMHLDWPNRLFLLGAPLCWALMIPVAIDRVRFGRRLRQADPEAPRAAVHRLAWHTFACMSAPLAATSGLLALSAVGDRLPAGARHALWGAIYALLALPYVLQRLWRIEVTRGEVPQLRGRVWQTVGSVLYMLVLALLMPFVAFAVFLLFSRSLWGIAVLAGVAALALFAARGLRQSAAAPRS